MQMISGQLQTLKQSGNGGDVGLQILNHLRQAGERVAEITRVGCREIEKSGRDKKELGEMAEYRQNMRGRVMQNLKEYMEIFCLRKVSEFGSHFVKEITEGCSQLKEEIEGHLMNADGTFRRLNEDMRKAMIEIDKKLKQNEGRSEEFESLIQHLTIQNRQKRK